LNQIKKLETEAEYYEKKGEKDKAYEVYEKIANLYEKAASKALLQSTRELYLMKAEEYRSRINTTKEKINGDEPDYIQIADGMIEKTNLTWDNISGLEKIKSLLRQAVGIAISKPEKPVKMILLDLFFFSVPLERGKHCLPLQLQTLLMRLFLTQIFQRSSQGM